MTGGEASGTPIKMSNLNPWITEIDQGQRTQTFNRREAKDSLYWTIIFAWR
jgi:hypothetical protein